MRRAITILALAAALWSDHSPARAQESTLAEWAARARSSRNDAAVAAGYGHALLRAGRLREADTQFRAAARLSRGSAPALFDVARVAFAGGDYQAARRACAPLTSMGAGAAVLAHVCNARAFLVWNRSARAFEELEAAIAAEPQNPEALLALGDAHRLRAEVAEAEQAYRRAAEAQPGSAEPYLGLGRLYVAAHRESDAVTALRRARELDATSPAIHYELGRLLPGAEGRTLLEWATQNRPRWPEALVALGEVLLKAGDAEGARAQFAAATEAGPAVADAHTGLGDALVRLGQLDPAERAFQKALELVPNSARAALGLGQIYEARGNTEAAYENYQRAADIDPAGVDAPIRAARLALTQNRDVLAAGFLDRLLEHHPNRAVALALYGLILERRGDRTEARAMFQRALAGEGPKRTAWLRASIERVQRPVVRETIIE